MVIVKHGNTAIELICDNCECEFIAAEHDYSIERDMYLHRMRRYVNCPECGRRVNDSYADWIKI